MRAPLLSYRPREPLEMTLILRKRIVCERYALLGEVTTDKRITGWWSGDLWDMGNREWRPQEVMG